MIPDISLGFSQSQSDDEEMMDEIARELGSDAGSNIVPAIRTDVPSIELNFGFTPTQAAYPILHSQTQEQIDE